MAFNLLANIDVISKKTDILYLANICDVKISEIAEIMNISVKKVIDLIKPKTEADKKWDVVYIIFALATDEKTAEVLADVWAGYLYPKFDNYGNCELIDRDTNKPVAKLTAGIK